MIRLYGYLETFVWFHFCSCLCFLLVVFLFSYPLFLSFSLCVSILCMPRALNSKCSSGSSFFLGYLFFGFCNNRVHIAHSLLKEDYLPMSYSWCYCSFFHFFETYDDNKPNVQYHYFIVAALYSHQQRILCTKTDQLIIHFANDFLCEKDYNSHRSSNLLWPNSIDWKSSDTFPVKTLAQLWYVVLKVETKSNKTKKKFRTLSKSLFLSVRYTALWT